MSTIVRKNGVYYPTLFDSIFGKNSVGQLLNSERHPHLPAVNVAESEDSYRIEFAVPGMKKEDFKISADGEKLTISAEAKSETEIQNEKYSRKEFGFQSFQRTFSLPETIDTEKISANYEAGILNVTLPKKETPEVPAARQIEIA